MECRPDHTNKTESLLRNITANQLASSFLSEAWNFNPTINLACCLLYLLSFRPTYTCYTGRRIQYCQLDPFFFFFLENNKLQFCCRPSLIPLRIIWTASSLQLKYKEGATSSFPSSSYDILDWCVIEISFTYKSHSHLLGYSGCYPFETR